MSSDFSDLLNLFKSCRVRYLIVGGHAVIKYTEPRFTKDLDIWIEAYASARPLRSGSFSPISFISI
jgi:hypothetical protein